MQAFNLLIATLLLSWVFPAYAGLDEAEAAYHKRDYATALKEWRALAKQRNARSEFSLGMMYSCGKGVKQSDSAAAKWMLKAANQGDAQAQTWIGAMYEYGHGVTQDYAEALAWFSKAAEQGDNDALINIGIMYEGGLGVTRDYLEAFRRYSQAATRGDTRAMMIIGNMYHDGKAPVPTIGGESMAWYLNAARQGDILAEYKVATMYEFGDDTPAIPEAALNWYREAANATYRAAMAKPDTCFAKNVGDYNAGIAAMSRLEEIYKNGELGEERNLRLAREWHEKAKQAAAALR